jgi:hypothetical protein
MIPFRSRSDSWTFTLEQRAIGIESNFSRRPYGVRRFSPAAIPSLKGEILYAAHRRSCSGRARRGRHRSPGGERGAAHERGARSRENGAAIDPVSREVPPTLRRDPRTGEWRAM